MLKLIDIYNKWGGDAYIEREGRWMKMSEGYCKGWDAKFKKDELYGKIGEDFVAQLIGTDEIKSEVKTERDIWKNSGNIAVEIRCGSKEFGKGRKSGISSTESEVWFSILSEKGVVKGGFIFYVDQLKALIKKREKVGVMKGRKKDLKARGEWIEGALHIDMVGDRNESETVFLPIKELF